jgi:hypothetical protein
MLSYVSRVFSGVAITVALLVLVAFRVTSCAPIPKAAPSAAVPAPHVLDCRAAGWERAAHINASSLGSLYWTPFGRDEVGWRVYAPLIGREIGSPCPPQSAAFAYALADWQKRHGFAPDGLVSQLTFVRLKAEVQNRRPFVLLSAGGVCAAAADEARLASAGPEERLSDKPVQLRPGALAAYRRMVVAARAEEPALAGDADLLRIFSGYRSPAYDAARCTAEHNCNGRERATCSAHRTGLAADLYLGHAPGFTADSSADANRLFLTEGPAYRWLVANAGRFGFVNYPFEPWHWEWTGEPPGGVSAGGSLARSNRPAGP